MAVSGGIPVLIALRSSQVRPDGFVGRSEELATLLDRSLPVTLVLGEPGGGKTRLLAEASYLAAWRQVFVTCHPSVATVPFEPLLSAVHAMHGGGTPDEIWERPTEAERLLVIRETFDAQSHGPGLLVQIDDLQWADDHTVDAIAYLSDRLRRRPIRWHIAGRVGDERSERLALRLSQLGLGNTIRLREFGQAEFRLFVAVSCGAIVDDARVGELYQLSGGNPLYAEQLLVAAAAGETTQPTGLQFLLSDRIRSLEGTPLDVARALAVASEAMSTAALADVTGLPGEVVAAAVFDLQKRYVAKSSAQGSQFRHELLRRECYAQIPQERRTELHLAMWRRTADSWRRAQHLDGAARRQDAADELLRHGLAMIDRADRFEAKAALDGAVERAADVHRVRLGAQAGLATLTALSGDVVRALDEMRRVEVQSSMLDPATRVDARSRFAEAIFEGSDECTPARPYLQLAIAEALTSVPEMLPRLYALAGAVADRSGLSQNAEDLLVRGLAAVGSTTPARDGIRLLSWLGVVHGRLGDSERGMRECEEAARAAAAANMSAEYAQCCMKCCYLSDIRGDRLAYEAWASRGLEFPGVKMPRVTAVLRLNLATALKDRGAITEAVEIAASAWESAHHAGTVLRVQAASSLALGYAMLGRFDDATRVVGDLRRLHVTNRWRRAIAFVSGRVAELRGDLAAALDEYRAVGWTLGTDHNPEGFDLRARAGEARVLFALGRLAEFAVLRAWMRDAALPDWPLTASLRAEVDAYGRIADGDMHGGCALLREVAAACKERFRAAALLLVAGLAASDRPTINEAVAEFDAMGAQAAAEAARRQARAIGFRPRSRPRTNAEITAVEGRIAGLISSGKTNAEIGVELGLSGKTVEHYVSNLLSKLGLRSRAQLAAAYAGGRKLEVRRAAGASNV